MQCGLIKSFKIDNKLKTTNLLASRDKSLYTLTIVIRAIPMIIFKNNKRKLYRKNKHTLKYKNK